MGQEQSCNKEKARSPLHGNKGHQVGLIVVPLSIDLTAVGYLYPLIFCMDSI